MFTRKPKTSTTQVDEQSRKKTAAKVLDLKKDLNSRLRYLKAFIESTDNVNELKQFFDANFSQIYFIFYESFVNVESNIKQKLNKQYKEELETVLFVFLKILLLQPERLHQRWQVRSIGRVIHKLIHVGNTKSIKFYGTRLFLIWYQILNVNKTHVEELMFQKLIQGFDTFHSSAQMGASSMAIDLLNAEAQKVFNQYDSNTTGSASSASAISIGRSIYPFEISPIIPVQPNEQQMQQFNLQQQQQTQANQVQSSQQQIVIANSNTSNSVFNLTAEMLKKMLEYMQQDCMNIEWYGDKSQYSQRCYEFLFEEFKRFYLSYMFPNAFLFNSSRNFQSTSQNTSSNTSTAATNTIASTNINSSTTTTGVTATTTNVATGSNQFNQYSSASNFNTQNSTALNVFSNVDLLTLLNEQSPPIFERPLIVSIGNLSANDERKLTQLHCKEEIIKWLISVLMIDISNSFSNNSGQSSSFSATNSSINTLVPSQNDQFHSSSNSSGLASLTATYENSSNLSNRGVDRSADLETLKPNNQEDIFSSLVDTDSSLLDQNSLQTTLTSIGSSFTSTGTSTTITANNNNSNKQLLQKVILSSATNVNLVHEILRNAFFLNFESYTTVQQVLNAYKKWFLKETTLPSFMLEPLISNLTNVPSQPLFSNTPNSISTAQDLDSPMSTSIIEDDKSNLSVGGTSEYGSGDHLQRTSSVSSYSACGSIQGSASSSTSNDQTRIGYMRSLQIFFFHSSNLLLNRTNLQRDKIRNICCYTLEIYKLFIRKIKMDYYTWTMLITILLRVSEFLFNSEYLVNNRTDPSTSHLIKLTTETVLLAIVRASFSFNLSIDLWDQLLNLMSSVNSNPDVIDKWIEVIDDLIRQIFKSFYNIDINNLPTIETTMEQKRKLKKKLLSNNNMPSNSVTPQPAPSNWILPNNSPQQSNSSQQMSQIKPRAKTEIYSTNSQPMVGLNAPISINNQINQSPAINLISHTSTTPGISSIQNSSYNQANSNIPQSSTTLSSTNVPSSVSSVQPLLSRQRNATISDIESTKSPSLSEEHFPAINGNKQSKSPEKKLSELSINTNKNSISKTIYGDFSNQDDSNLYDDELDENGDKSATLKAATQMNTVSSTNVNKLINRFSSDKSIYYSSELLTEAASNNASINLNDNDSSNSSNSQIQNVSFTVSPPSNTNNLVSKFSPPQQPPPLPPLPPSLASKYGLTRLQLDCEATNSNNNNNNTANSTNITNNQSYKSVVTSGETSSLDSDFGGSSFASGSVGPIDSNEFRAERQIKCTSTCSEFDVFLKDFINSSAPQIDTPSEAASMSGGELSGETYASPSLNTYPHEIQNFQTTQPNLNENPINSTSLSTSSLLVSTNIYNNLNNLNNNTNTSDSLNSTSNSAQSVTYTNTSLMSGINIVNTDNLNLSYMPDSSNNGLLSIDHRNNDERSGSFIDSKYIRDQSSRASTLTTSTIVQENSSGTHRNSMIDPNSISNEVQNNTFNIEASFKETSLTLLKRLFGCLGNINAIKDPFIHKKVFEFIHTKWERLGKIKESFKLTDLCQVIPSITYFSPWFFESIYSLSNNYQSGKLIAYKVICRIGIRSVTSGNLSNDPNSINEEFMDLFYLTIHQGLRSDDKNVINCIIQNCGTKFWHCMLPSCTLLLKDFIDASAIVDSQGPKYEAASILGCLIGFPDYFGDMKVLTDPNHQSTGNLQAQQVTPNQANDDLTVEFFTKEDIKNLIIHTITNFTDDVSNTNSRSVILCILTCFIYEEILNQRWHSRLNDAIRRIFKDLEFREQLNLVLVKMSCDNLRFLSILATLIFQFEIQYAINIINELNQCLVKLINGKPSNISDDYEKAIIANMFALLEWCMNMPLEKLKDQDRATLLRNNFKLLIHICNTFKPNESIESEHIHLAARFIIQHLLVHLNHFPFASTGPSKIVSSVNEISDFGLNTDELLPILFEQPNLQFFTVNNQFLISFIELPMKGNEQFFNISPNLKMSNTICRFIVRDFCGKNCWDCCILNSPDECLPNTYFLDIPFKNPASSSNSAPTSTDSNLETSNENSTAKKTDSNINNFDYTQIPFLDFDDIPKDIDILDNILKYISYSSPECRLEPSKPLNVVWDINPHLNSIINFEDIMQKLLTQSSLEQKHAQSQHEAEMLSLQSKMSNFQTKEVNIQLQLNENNESNTTPVHHYFHLCKSFVHQMGLLSWEKRQSFNLLRKTPQLLRELKSLDDQTCRETHKIAVIFIAEGQDDKISILSNERGSPDYEDFLSMLAWTVDLESHEGFMGGLQHNYQLKTAPYYSNSICEVLFHVSTQMNNQNDLNKISKWRHLGNDSVQIIWSEHSKDYDRNILATEFADVIICIYPLKNGLYRIQISKKSSVGFFGPLFDGAIINKQALPTLIRATAINASRILLSNTKGYQDFFVHRAHAINNIIRTLTEKQTFEQFIGDIYSPAITPSAPATTNTQLSSGLVSSSTTTSSNPNARRDNQENVDFPKYNF